MGTNLVVLTGPHNVASNVCFHVFNGSKLLDFSKYLTYRELIVLKLNLETICVS